MENIIRTPDWSMYSFVLLGHLWIRPCQLHNRQCLVLVLNALMARTLFSAYTMHALRPLTAPPFFWRAVVP